jgi:multiple sugar transport system ATP-binding protein
MASVSLKHIYKKYPGGVTAVSDFNLEIKDKEFLVLVGPSGCGKTTTLRMVAGLEEISEGELFIGDQLVNDVAPKDRKIAMVFQNYALYPHMTVFENMAFGLKLNKTPKEEIKRRVEEAARILDITHLLDRKPKALSGGQKQRVALGRAIVRNPKVFLLDEPLSNLDAKLRASMRTELTKLHQRVGTTFIYVTHDQVEAMTMATRIVVMKDGLIQQVDTPQNLYDYPVNIFVAGFIGTPQMNFFKICMRVENGVMKAVFADGTEMSFDITAMREIHEGYCDGNTYECVLGVRGEHIDIVEKGLSVQIGLVEILGSETHLHVHMEGGNKEIIVNLRDRGDFKAEDQICLDFNAGKIHLFDAETTQSIMSRKMKK